MSVWCVWRFGVEGRQWSVCHFEEVSECVVCVEVWCGGSSVVRMSLRGSE